MQDRHFFDDLGKIIDLYNKANSQSPANPGSGDDPSDLFQQQLLQEDGGKPLFNFGKLNGSGDPFDPPSSSPLIPVMGGPIPNTNTPSPPTPNGPTTNIFIWTGGTGPWTLGPNWTPGSSPGSPGDIVEVPTGTVIYNNNFTIGTLIVGPNGTLDIVGGSLTVVNGASDGGTIIVEGDPPALTINGPVTVGNIGSFTATGSGDEIQFANGTVDNHGAISAVKQGTVSFVNERITNEPDGKILARGKGSEIEFAGAILTNLGIVVATHHGIVQLSDVMLQNGGLIAADDGGKIWITDLQHGSANYGLVEAIDGGKITIVSDNNNGSGGSGSDHSANFGNIEAIGRGSIVDIENKNGDSFDNQSGGTVAALDGGKILFSGDVNNHFGGAIDAQSGGLITFDTGKVTNEHCSTIEASTSGSEIDLSCTTVWNDGVIAAKHGGIVDIANSTITQGSDGVVAAIGHDLLVNLEGAAIVGGSLETSCGGVVQTACGDSLLENVTITCDSQILVNDGTSLALEGRIDNRGTIWLGELPSQGGGDNHNFTLIHTETDLVIDHCVTLTGQGSIVLAGDDDKIVGADCGGSLYNVNDTISGAGAIGEGSGDLKLVNGSCGVIDANSHGQTLMIDTGNAITNLGILEVTNGGLLQVQDAVNDCGSGHVLIKDGTIEFDAAANVDVTFDNCTGYGKLVLGDAKDFAGTISGFGGTDVNNTDEIDLKCIATDDVTFSEDDAGDAVIAITKSGTNQVLTKITLDNFDYQNLEKTSDGHGGTTIYDPPAISSAGPSVSIGGTGNDTFVFHPGEGAQMVNNFNPQHDTIDLDHFASIHGAQELAAAITPDVHGNVLLELGHGDSIAIPGVGASFLQQNLQSLVHLHT